MAFKRLFIISLLILIGSLPSPSLAQKAIKSSPDVNYSPPVVEKPTDAEALPLVKWDLIDVKVVEGKDAWLALRTDTPINTTSGIRIDIELYTSNAANGADIDTDFDREITLPQTNQSRDKQITGYISGTSQVLYVQLRTVSDTINEENEIFFVDVTVSNGTIESRGNRATITIVRDTKFYPAFANFQSCQDVGEPNNNLPARSGFLAISGGPCYGDFNGENPGAVDYYRISSGVGGNVTIRLKNTTPNQHDLDLYLYKYNTSTNSYDEVAKSDNANQLDDVINFPIVANTSNNNGLYLVTAYWAVATGSNVPTYDLSASFQ
ncbi:hypothetical protein [Herpetosiphon geysericola]|uniref:Calx-beta domain-containing protein n=1 Tax=Herpetosiphon geysericola TaxID=70996 RepID=A0A0P6XZW8_9CHLR|nr:hypothetical protein [Herpetosiphon geysericola]KPL90577.1 hypothetical protein SE18_05705 [Herpetosiphon geysericola]